MFSLNKEENISEKFHVYNIIYKCFFCITITLLMKKKTFLEIINLANSQTTSSNETARRKNKIE